MPISKNITIQQNLTCTYHVVSSLQIDLTAETAFAGVASFVNKGDTFPARSMSYDISAMSTAFSGATTDATEKFLLTTPDFTGGTQVA